MGFWKGVANFKGLTIHKFSPNTPNILFHVFASPAGEYLTFHELEDSAKLDLSIHVTGEAEQATRLFPQTIMGGVDHPLDLQVTLKVMIKWNPEEQTNGPDYQMDNTSAWVSGLDY